MISLQSSVAVVGDVMLDVYISGEATRLSPEAPVPIVSVTKRTQTLGGAGNVALNLSSLGCRAYLFGLRGNDVAGNMIVSILHDNKVEYTLYVDQLLPTTTKTRIMASHQQLLRYDDERLNGSHGCYKYLKAGIEEVLPLMKAIVISDYGKGVLVYDLSRFVIDYADRCGVSVLVDPKCSNWTCYNGATVITPNTRELEGASGGMNCDDDNIALDCADSLRRAHKIQTIVVTRGDKGMLVVDDDGHEFIPTVAKSVFDVSGAGDTVIATMAACIGSNYTVREAAKIANVAAGIVVGKLGTSPIEINELQENLGSIYG